MTRLHNVLVAFIHPYTKHFEQILLTQVLCIRTPTYVQFSRMDGSEMMVFWHYGCEHLAYNPREAFVLQNVTTLY